MLLLDSHVIVWLMRGDRHLGPRCRVIEDHHPAYYSGVTVFELMIKRLNGRIELPGRLSAVLEEHGLRQLPLAGEHVEAMADFPELVGHDPFDRALLAQAHVEGLTFITADQRLLAMGRPGVLDAAV